MKVIAIIVTYNSQKYIEACLASIQRSSYPLSAVVIDNASTDHTLQIIQDKFPETHLFLQEKNLGFGQANNIGIKYALEQNADAVLLLNADASLHAKAVEALVEQSDGESLLSPLHMNGDGSRFDYMFKFTSLYKSDNTFVDDLQTNQVKIKYPIGEVCAACWFLPIEIVKKIGGFNPLFFHYGEDSNYYNRLQYHGIQSYIVSQALMFHDRLIQGNMKIYKRGQILREMMVVCCNINYNKRIIIKETLRVIKCNLSHFGQGMISLFRLVAKIRRISKSRKQEKKLFTSWI